MSELTIWISVHNNHPSQFIDAKRGDFIRVRVLVAASQNATLYNTIDAFV